MPNTVVLDSSPGVKFITPKVSLNSTPAVHKSHKVGTSFFGRNPTSDIYVSLNSSPEYVRDLLEVKSTDTDVELKKGFETLTEDMHKKEEKAGDLNEEAFKKAAIKYLEKPKAERERSPSPTRPPPVVVDNSIPTPDTANIAAAATTAPASKPRKRKSSTPQKIQPKKKKEIVPARQAKKRKAVNEVKPRPYKKAKPTYFRIIH